jgi:hypothetical protein
VAGAVRCPVLVLAGEDDPICPLPVVEELASRLPAQTTRLVRLPGARHTIFRDRPDLAFPAVRSFAFDPAASSRLCAELMDRRSAGMTDEEGVLAPLPFLDSPETGSPGYQGMHVLDPCPQPGLLALLDRCWLR